MTDAKRSDTDNINTSLDVHIGSLDNVRARFAAAWHAGETGKAVTRDTPHSDAGVIIAAIPSAVWS